MKEARLKMLHPVCFYYVVYLKRQNCRGGEEIGGCQGLGVDKGCDDKEVTEGHKRKF